MMIMKVYEYSEKKGLFEAMNAPMDTMSVMLGVSFTKKGRRTAARTHREMSRTSSASWPHARPMPRSPIPCGHERFSSSASAPDASASRASCSQSSLLKPHIMLAITTCR